MKNHSIQLQKVERLANGGKLSRLMHSPARYLYAMMLSKVIYPVTHKGVLKKAPLFFGGNMQVLLPAATDIYLAGGKTHSSEIRLAKYMINQLEAGDSFFDIGAHFGYFTLLAASLVGDTGKVYSIEPAGGTYNLLQQNAATKGNIETFHKAVSDKAEMVTFYEFPVLYSEYNTLDAEKFLKEDWIKKYNPGKAEVQATTIDGFLHEHNITPAIIKVDVEGAEVQAILGGSETWQGQPVILVMEYLDEGNESSYTQAAAIMYGYGYRSYMITDEGTLAETRDILSYMRQHGMTSENIVFKK